MPRVELLEARTYLSVKLGPAVELGGVTSPAGIVLGDFDADGLIDVAMVGIDPTGQLHSVAISLSGAPPVFYDLPGDNSAQSIVAADFNEDGNTDLAVTDPVDGTVSVLLGNGDGTFQTPITTSFGTAQPVGSAATAYLVSADFNGDGMPDLAVTDPADHQISILLGNGSGAFTLGTPITSTEASFDPRHIVASDFNNDDLTDLIYNDGTAPEVDLVEGTGKGTFGAPIPIPVNGAVQGFATADIRNKGQRSKISPHLSSLRAGPAKWMCSSIVSPIMSPHSLWSPCRPHSPTPARSASAMSMAMD